MLGRIDLACSYVLGWGTVLDGRLRGIDELGARLELAIAIMRLIHGLSDSCS